MSALNTPNAPARRPRRPRSNGGVRSKRLTNAKALSAGHAHAPHRTDRDAAPGDADLPLLREIADQLRQLTNLDLATALRQSRQLLNGAFHAIDDGHIESAAIAS